MAFRANYKTTVQTPNQDGYVDSNGILFLNATTLGDVNTGGLLRVGGTIVGMGAAILLGGLAVSGEAVISGILPYANNASGISGGIPAGALFQAPDGFVRAVISAGVTAIATTDGGTGTAYANFAALAAAVNALEPTTGVGAGLTPKGASLRRRALRSQRRVRSRIRWAH